MYMNRSTFCEIKYMNRLFLQRLGIWLVLVSKHWLPHPYLNYPEAPPHNHRGYERVYKFKEQYMNRSTFCEIKYMNRLGFFKGCVYDWGWFQSTDMHTRAKITWVHPPPPSLKLFTFCLCKLCAIIFWATSCPNYTQWMTRYHLELLYSDEAHPAALPAMLETWAMFIRWTNKPLLGPLWIGI